MVDLLFPPNARVSAQRIDALSNTESARSIFTGAVTTLDRTGDRWRWGINTQSASHRETFSSRAALQAFRHRARGMGNRILFGDPAYQQRGLFPSSEKLPNSTFLNGTSGFTSGSETSLSAADGVARCTRSAMTITQPALTTSSAVPVTQYLPVVIRAMLMQGRGSYSSFDLAAGSSAGGGDYFDSTNVTSYGMLIASFTPWSTSLYPSIREQSSSGLMAGDYFEVPYFSVSQCTLIDNSPNLLLRSDELDNVSSWARTRCTVSANAVTAPDGTLTAESIVEDSTAAQTHFIDQGSVTVSSSAADFCFTVALKAGTRTFAALQIGESTGGTTVTAYINLSAGAAGTVNTGANWANARSFVDNMGNGWYRLHLVARKTSAATSLNARIYIAEADNDSVFNGNGSGNIYVWRGGLAASSVPFRPGQTTSANTSGTTQTGASLYSKGWPASTSGLLLPGDRVQIGTQKIAVVAPVNSDAAGRAYLQLAYPPRVSPSDNAPIIMCNPMARCILTTNEGGWSDSPGGFSDFEFELEEALDS